MIQIQWLELKPEDGGVLMQAPHILTLPEGSTASAALRTIGWPEQRIVTLLERRAVAIYGMYATENTVLHEGDRLEILDELNFDPMESRRRRAQHKVLTKGRRNWPSLNAEAASKPKQSLKSEIPWFFCLQTKSAGPGILYNSLFAQGEFACVSRKKR